MVAPVSALAVMLAPGNATAASFTVVDDKADEEISETTRLYIDGQQVANIHLDDAVTQAKIPIAVADRKGRVDHDYTLCGEITYRAMDGSRQVREVSGQGTLPAPDGHSFVAVGARDFTSFYLVDPSDRMASRPDPGPSPFCQAPIS